MSAADRPAPDTARFSSGGYALKARVLLSPHKTTGPLDHFQDDVLAAIRFDNFSIDAPSDAGR